MCLQKTLQHYAIQTLAKCSILLANIHLLEQWYITIVFKPCLAINKSIGILIGFKCIFNGLYNKLEYIGSTVKLVLEWVADRCGFKPDCCPSIGR